MLKLIIGEEFYDEATETFTVPEAVVLELEHSLVSLSKWESKYQKPFLGHGVQTPEEVLGYIEAMIVTPDFPPEVIKQFGSDDLLKVNQYIASPQSATTFNLQRQSKGRQQIVTAELIYYWMVAFNIPFSCETWHLNRLFTLIRVCNINNGKQPKMSAKELAQRNRELNAQRRQQLGTTG